VQGRSNLEALACLFKIETVKVFDIYTDIAENYAAEMQTKLGISIEVVASAKSAVHEMDIVVTSGPILKSPNPVIPAGWLKPGGFASPVDFDSYWQGSALAQADKLATDDRSQMEYYRQEGYFKSTPMPYADLGEIIAGKMPGRESEEERTVSINLGLALDDMATAILIYKRALDMGIGLKLPL